MSVHSIVINRSIAGGRPGGLAGGSSSTSRTTTIEKSTSYNTGSGMTPDQYHSVTTTGVESVKSSRSEQKKDMQDLNDRFASYIEKVINFRLLYIFY